MDKGDQKITTKKKKSVWELELGGVGLVQLEQFAKTMGVMLDSGIPVGEALEIAEDSANGKLKNILGEMRLAVQSGRAISDALSQYPRVFSSMFVNTIKVGETSGTLGENFENLAVHIEKERELRSKVFGALLYPIIILVAALGMGVFVMYYVFPKITPLFKQLKIELPIYTKVLLWMTQTVQDYGWWILVGFILFSGIIAWTLISSTTKPMVDWLWLKLPGVKRIVINVQLNRFCRTLGTLLKGGVHIDRALEITAQIMGNYYYQKAVEKMGQSVSKGGKLSDNLDTEQKLFPKLTTRMIKVGEKTGKLDKSLLYLGQYHEHEVTMAAKSLPVILEPILLLVIGLGIGFLALAIMSPIFSMSGGIKR